jgi:hypothetical protein
MPLDYQCPYPNPYPYCLGEGMDYPFVCGYMPRTKRKAREGRVTIEVVHGPWPLRNRVEEARTPSTACRPHVRPRSAAASSKLARHPHGGHGHCTPAPVPKKAAA